jgi:hypothetical protein
MSVVSAEMTGSAYISLVPSLEDGVVDDLRNSVEIPDASYMFGVDGEPYLYVFNSSSELIRYELGRRGELEEGPTLSFLSSGVTAGASERSVFFVSEDKAYLLDDVSLQAVVFNPSTMLITSKIDLGELQKAGWTAYFDYRPKLRDGKLVVAAFYFDDTFSVSLPETSVAIIDTATDAVQLGHDTRCGGFSTSVLAENGDLYFASDPYVGAIERVSGQGAGPGGCLLRMRAGEDGFDPEYYAEVAALAPGFGGGLVRGFGSSAYVSVYDEQLRPLAQNTSALDLYGHAAWRFWRIELGSDAAATEVDLAPGAGTLRAFSVDGVTYATAASEDYATTTLVNMSGAEEPTSGLRVPGNVAGVVRVR